jgi:hypothetical protein
MTLRCPSTGEGSVNPGEKELILVPCLAPALPEVGQLFGMPNRIGPQKLVSYYLTDQFSEMTIDPYPVPSPTTRHCFSSKATDVEKKHLSGS